MEYKCTSCGNVFDNTLGTCPACGTPVENNTYAEAEQPAQEQANQQMPNQEQPNYQQMPNQEQPNYQQMPNQGQPNYQQMPNQGQPNYQQMPNQGQPNYQQPPYQQVPYQQPPYQGQQKSKIAAGVLGILLGALGVHNFYLGYTSKAVAQLLITLLSCGTLAIVSEVWGLVDGIMILTGSINTDVNGIPLSD